MNNPNFLAMLLAGAWITANSALAQSSSAISLPQYSFQYDALGNLTQTTDALGRVTKQSYDALSRRITSADPNNGNAQYSYDALNNLSSVIDPKGFTTIYQVDVLGNLNLQQSPDTGPLSSTYDAAGNLLTQTDAKQQTTRFTYDALNRMSSVSYADGTSATFTYDQGANAIGRLTRITDASGSIQYFYDVGGRVVTEIRTIANMPYVTGYQYDGAGSLSAITYPSGRTIGYTRDAMGRINRISSTTGGVTTVLVSQVQYRPFGGVQSYVNSAGNTYSRSFDTAGRIISYTMNGQQQVVTYDGANNIVSMIDPSNGNNSTTYNYDALDRLTSAVSPLNNVTYTYDANGNRLNQTIGANSSSYTYGTASNQLTQVAGSQTVPYLTDANGSTTSNGVNQYVYDARGRLSSAITPSGSVQYAVNTFGQRVQKISSYGSTVFEYDGSGKLIGEVTTFNGTSSGKDYVYLGDILVTVIQL